jgi:hypothetical protein
MANQAIIMRTIEAAKPASGRDVFTWDTSLWVCGLTVTPKGIKTYVLQYRVDGRAKPAEAPTSSLLVKCLGSLMRAGNVCEVMGSTPGTLIRRVQTGSAAARSSSKRLDAFSCYSIASIDATSGANKGSRSGPC